MADKVAPISFYQLVNGTCSFPRSALSWYSCYTFSTHQVMTASLFRRLSNVYPALPAYSVCAIIIVT